MTDVITPIALRGARGLIADKMVASLAQAAQLTHMASADMSMILRRKSFLSAQDKNISIEDLLIDKAVATLIKHPSLNGTITGRDISLHSAINLSVAMALPNNLLVAPAIFNAQAMDLENLRNARQDLSARAKANKLTTSEMTSGTFTVSNLGLSRVHYFTPILNIPQIAILGIGCTEQRVIEHQGTFSIRPFVGLSLTFDHRAIDGSPAANFLSDLCRAIESD